MDHAEGYIALLSDTATAACISEEGPLSRDAAIAKLQRLARQSATDSAQAYFAIIHGVSGEFLGYAAAHNRHAEICPISYAILPRHRRQGVAKAAIHALLDHLSPHSSAEWIEARTHPENIASIATLRSCGFVCIAQADNQMTQRVVYRRKR